MKTNKLYMSLTNVKKNHSLSARLASFRPAVNGLRHLVASEPNARIHLLATAAAVSLLITLHCSAAEYLLVFVCMGMVWSAELLNTSVEKICDMITLEKQPRIRIIKDMSAAAVLVASLVALLAGAYVFIPKII
jgi:diacylglycerol kinase